MAIPLNITYLSQTANKHTGQTSTVFNLLSLSDVNGIENPQALGTFITAKSILIKAAGTLIAVDPYGNEVTIVISASMVDREIRGPFNGLKATGTVTIVASDIIIYG